MAVEAVCQFFKYGFCKYRETCRKFHSEETCENEHCETLNCLKRHPRECKYYKIYKRCKFGSYCLFTHVSEESTKEANDEKLDAKFEYIEKEVENLKATIKASNAKIEDLEEKNKFLQIKLEAVIESTKAVCAASIKKATDSVTELIFKQQDSMEKKQNAWFDLISRNISAITMPSVTNSHQEPQPQYSQPCQLSQTSSQPLQQPKPKLQCDICGKTFGSSRALSNHTRSDHTP